VSKKPNKRQLIRRFIDTYMLQFEDQPDVVRLVVNLVADDITDVDRLQNYIIVSDYNGLLNDNGGRVNETIIELADSYSMTRSQIQNIVYKWSGKYKVMNNIID